MHALSFANLGRAPNNCKHAPPLPDMPVINFADHHTLPRCANMPRSDWRKGLQVLVELLDSVLEEARRAVRWGRGGDVSVAWSFRPRFLGQTSRNRRQAGMASRRSSMRLIVRRIHAYPTCDAAAQRHAQRLRWCHACIGDKSGVWIRNDKLKALVHQDAPEERTPRALLQQMSDCGREIVPCVCLVDWS
jgi:hypothetical protein